MSEKAKSEYTKDLCKLAPIMPVLVVQEVAAAKPLARALIEGGVSILEVTLRTPSALAVIQEMSTVPGAVVAAGTITNPDELKAAKQAGAKFGVTPGITAALLAAAETESFPLLPGVSTVSEMMTAVCVKRSC